MLRLFLIPTLILASAGVEAFTIYRQQPFMDHGMHGNHSTPGGMDHSMMKMYFHVGAHETILFQQWVTHNWQQMLGACIGVFFLAALYEGLKVGREVLKVVMSRQQAGASESYPVATIKISPAYGSTESTEKLTSTNITSVRSRICNLSHFIQTLLHILQVWISLCLMLVFMTYNVWLCLAVALGAGAGFFLFAWLVNKGTYETEHCN